MAIGDTPNQNLFGTNYNAEDEEEKKARLAAQGAMMGADIPASAFGQAPAVAPFSMEAAGQVNPMMEPQSLATESVSSLITNNPFLSTGETPVAAQPPVKNALLEMLERADAREAQGLPRQDAPGIIDAPVETPSVSAQEQPGAVVSPFLQSPNTPSGLGGPLLRGLEMVNDAARGPNAPMGQDATRAALGGMTLNEYLNAPAGTEGVSGLQTDPQGRMITPSAQPPVDSAVAPATAQPPVDALSSFEQDSLSRQQRIGGTGSFEGDSEAREARLRENERQPGESQADRDTRMAQSRTTGGQTEGLSFDDARRRAEGQLAERGVRNPSASQVNALARGIQAGEPERLAELETEGAINEAKLKTAQATLDRPEFEGKVYTINGVTFAQTSNGGAQVISTGTETPEEATAKMKDYAFALEQIDKARKAYQAGDIDKANDIFTAAEIQKDGFATNATEYFKDSITPPASKVTDSGLTQQQESGIQNVMATNKITREDAIKALKEAGKLK